MPFDEENDDEQLSPKAQRVGLKKVSSQKSIFEEMQKKPTQEEFDQKVKNVQERTSNYKIQAAALASQFNKAMADKTLSENKNIFQQEIEKELMKQMVQLAIEINNDIKELEGMGSLGWITLLMKTCFSQRDRLNKLEYTLLQLVNKTEAISKEISKPLDNKKDSE